MFFYNQMSHSIQSCLPLCADNFINTLVQANYFKFFLWYLKLTIFTIYPLSLILYLYLLYLSISFNYPAVYQVQWQTQYELFFLTYSIYNVFYLFVYLIFFKPSRAPK